MYETQDDRGGDRRYREEACPFPDHLLIPAPAAGAVASLAVDSSFELRIRSVVATLTTSAAAGNRFPTLRVEDPEGNTWYGVVATPAIAANGAAVEVWFSEETQHGGPDGTKLVAGATPNLWIPGGWKIEVGAVNLDVADQFSAVRLYVAKRTT